jgi:hypothetical protein
VGDDMGEWYAVRCVFAVGWPPEAQGRTYEERINLWRASSADEAIARAEAEAAEYASASDGQAHQYLGLAQSYHLFDQPGDGAEVFSLMRDSDLGPPGYLAAHFSTGGEHQRSS